ncbi:MAG: MarR family winged helix-turn-helix transcriptional regulator [Mariprofundaceae bacterium]
MNVELPIRFEDSLGYLVHHLLYTFRQGINRKLEGAGYNVRHEELGVLIVLNQEDDQTQSQLSESLAKDKAVITRLLNRLVKDGLVERRHDAKDRRIVRARLTTAGKQTSQRLLPMLWDFISKALEGVDQKEFKDACGVLQQILANLRKLGRAC